MQQSTAEGSASVVVGSETGSDCIKSPATSRTGIVASIMEKYTLADPWSAKNEKVCCKTGR
jgi:hypothetical protein